MDKDLEKELRKFNWAACLGTWIWAIGNKVKHWTAYVSFIFFLCTFTPLGNIPMPVTLIRILVIISWIIPIYMGFIGNKLAYYNKDNVYESIQDFQEQQKKWVGIILKIYLVLFICGILFAGLMPSHVSVL